MRAARRAAHRPRPQAAAGARDADRARDGRDDRRDARRGPRRRVLRAVLEPRLTDSALRLLGENGALLRADAAQHRQRDDRPRRREGQRHPERDRARAGRPALPGSRPDDLIGELQTLVGDGRRARADPPRSRARPSPTSASSRRSRASSASSTPTAFRCRCSRSASPTAASSPAPASRPTASCRCGCRRISSSCKLHPRRRRADPRRRARVRRRGGLARGRRGSTEAAAARRDEVPRAAPSRRPRSRAGDELTLFNRGETNPELFPEAEKLRGDRDGDLAALAGREWDVVVDPSGFVPRVVAASAELLAGAVGHYVFVSSISVYAPPTEPGLDESAPVIELDDPASEDVPAGLRRPEGTLRARGRGAVPRPRDPRPRRV